MKVFKSFHNYLLTITYLIIYFIDGEPSLVVEFKGHKEKINELAWSPHRNVLLLSCSNDFTAKVCEVKICM